MSGHQGTVLGLLALIVVIRVVESARVPAAWSAVFGTPTTVQPGAATVTPAAPTPAPSTAPKG